MITWEKIVETNKRVAKVEIKGKMYACVPARIQAFREMCPDGSITTDIIAFNEGEVVVKATIADETGKVLATGIAMEKESSSYINKTSYIENCETSAVGRALGMIGIGSEEQLASAEELANAISNHNVKPGVKEARQSQKEADPEEKITERMAKAFEDRCGSDTMLENFLFNAYKVSSWCELTNKQALQINKHWDEAVKKSRGNA